MPASMEGVKMTQVTAYIPFTITFNSTCFVTTPRRSLVALQTYTPTTSTVACSNVRRMVRPPADWDTMADGGSGRPEYVVHSRVVPPQPQSSRQVS